MLSKILFLLEKWKPWQIVLSAIVFCEILAVAVIVVLDLAFRARLDPILIKEAPAIFIAIVIIASALVGIFIKLRKTEKSVLETRLVEIEDDNARKQAILSSIGDGVLVVDKDRKVLLMNKAAEKMLGWQADEIIGKDIYDVRTTEDEKGNFVPVELRPIHIALDSLANSTDKYYYLDKTKKRFPVAITAAPVMLNGKIIGAVDIFRDISREKDLARVKNEFISVASHQIRAPLANMLWAIEALFNKEKLSKKVQEDIGVVYDSMRHLATLVDQLLNISSIEAGQALGIAQPVEMASLVQKNIDGEKVMIGKKSLAIDFKHPASLIVTSDSAALNNIIQSLISNAVDYTPNNGKIEIVLDREGDKVLLKVGDSGIGIPEDERANIFNKFYRATNAKNFKERGTGLGLYIALQSTKLLGGKIWVESEEGNGATFFVELPLESKK